jgi:hypothetical protein
MGIGSVSGCLSDLMAITTLSFSPISISPSDYTMGAV